MMSNLRLPGYLQWHLILHPFPCKQGDSYEIPVSSGLVEIPIKVKKHYRFNYTLTFHSIKHETERLPISAQIKTELQTSNQALNTQ